MSERDGPDQLCKRFMANMAEDIYVGKATLMRMSSAEAASKVLEVTGGRKADMIFLDGDHEYASVSEDIKLWRKALVPGGLLCGHDYAAAWHGVVKAVDENVRRVRLIEGTTIWMEGTTVGTYFIDMDGTFFRFGTQEPLPGAVDAVRRLASEGHRIFFVTLRNASEGKLGSVSTRAALASLGVEYDDILWDCPSPRTVVNDDGAHAVNHVKNSPLSYEAITGRS
jgi:hypothetical protein